MNENEIKEYILETFDGLDVIEDEGNFFFFYDPENKIPFATIVTSDKYDTHSNLDRPGVFRLNIGIGKETFRSMFPIDKVPLAAGYDFKALDELMPHPDYGRMYWVAILNPSESNFANIKPLLHEAFEIAVKKYNAASVARGKTA